MGVRPLGVTQRSAYNSYFQLSFKLWSLGRPDNDWVMSTLTRPVLAEVSWDCRHQDVPLLPPHHPHPGHGWPAGGWGHPARWDCLTWLSWGSRRCLNIIDWMFRLIIYPPSLSCTNPGRACQDSPERNSQIIAGSELHQAGLLWPGGAWWWSDQD